MAVVDIFKSQSVVPDCSNQDSRLQLWLQPERRGKPFGLVPMLSLNKLKKKTPVGRPALFSISKFGLAAILQVLGREGVYETGSFSF